MEQKKIANILVPAAAVAALIVLVGLVLVVGNADDTKKGGGSPGAADSGGNPPFTLDSPEYKTVDGVKVWDVKEGTGAPCPAGPVDITVHYTGWLTNGTQFDSSKGKGPPANFNLGGALITGWKKGIPGMKAGGVRRLVIPPELGYGAGGDRKIPGGATLMFEIEMISFKG